MTSGERSPEGPPRVEGSEEEWRKRLTPEQFRVAREGGTEKPFSSGYWDETRDGTYHCACCGLLLFDSSTKYDSGSGWPSFYQVHRRAHVLEREDRSLFMRRTEVLCAACDAHLGHVFPDGPPPTGFRYCVNSAALEFRPSRDSGSEE